MKIGLLTTEIMFYDRLLPRKMCSCQASSTKTLGILTPIKISMYYSLHMLDIIVIQNFTVLIESTDNT